uniref:HDC15019 n=1 Tax=Drosophila melanogaster TaxID=7227 RepID=Q6IJF1_DROME|nr:TPA_inf: HDC15019 [Drosophila melanogaster]
MPKSILFWASSARRHTHALTHSQGYKCKWQLTFNADGSGGPGRERGREGREAHGLGNLGAEHNVKFNRQRRSRTWHEKARAKVKVKAEAETEAMPKAIDIEYIDLAPVGAEVGTWAKFA